MTRTSDARTQAGVRASESFGGDTNRVAARPDNVPTYKAVHHRLRAILGPASAHLCADCDHPALDWSLEGPAEYVDPRGCGYSTRPDHYAPRCRSCHIRFDRARREHIPGRHEARRGTSGQMIPNTTLDAS